MGGINMGLWGISSCVADPGHMKRKLRSYANINHQFITHGASLSCQTADREIRSVRACKGELFWSLSASQVREEDMS